jgi:hypothetical protein
MKVLSPVYPGSIFICADCGCLFSYLPQDINENCFVYCPVCHVRQRVPMAVSINEEVKNDEIKENI